MSTANHPSTFPVILFISHSNPVVTSPVWGFSEKLLAKEDAGLYDFINQGCLDVDGMDDKEEMKGTDVCKIQSLESSFVILLVDTKEMTRILIMHSHTTLSVYEMLPAPKKVFVCIILTSTIYQESAELETLISTAMCVKYVVLRTLN